MTSPFVPRGAFQGGLVNAAIFVGRSRRQARNKRIASHLCSALSRNTPHLSKPPRCAPHPQPGLILLFSAMSCRLDLPTSPSRFPTSNVRGGRAHSKMDGAQRSIRLNRGGASAREGIPSLRHWAIGCGFVSAVLWLLVVGVEGGLPTTNESLGGVAHGWAPARWGEASLVRGGGDDLVVTERPQAPPDVLPNPQAVSLPPQDGIRELVTGVRFQPIEEVSWKDHPTEAGLRAVQWIRATIETADLNTGRGTSDTTRQFVRDLGGDIHPPGPQVGDDTGHFVARRLGGTGKTRWAVFPQLRRVNNGEFKRFEQGAYDKVQQVGSIRYFVRLEYNAPPVQWPLRPISYRAAYCWVENNLVRWYGEAFPN